MAAAELYRAWNARDRHIHELRRVGTTWELWDRKGRRVAKMKIGREKARRLMRAKYPLLHVEDLRARSVRFQVQPPR